MIECKEISGKVIRSLSLFEDSGQGAEVSIEFEDGSNFTARLENKQTLSAKWTHDEGGEPRLLREYTSPL